jgi:hypothetical protein
MRPTLIGRLSYGNGLSFLPNLTKLVLGELCYVHNKFSTSDRET